MRVTANAMDMHVNVNNYVKENNQNLANSGEKFYENLKTWTKGANGESKLVSLSEMPTGAVYLSSNESKDRLIDTEKMEMPGTVRIKDMAEKMAVGSHIDLVL